MLRGPASLLSRLAQRAPLARVALPLLAAYAPEAFRCARSLHVLVRTPASRGGYSKVEVGDGADAGDLKSAVCAQLKLDAPPDCVRLLREVAGGGAPVPLDSARLLAKQGVREGTSVVAEVLLPPRPPPRCTPLLASSLPPQTLHWTRACWPPWLAQTRPTRSA